MIWQIALSSSTTKMLFPLDLGGRADATDGAVEVNFFFRRCVKVPFIWYKARQRLQALCFINALRTVAISYDSTLAAECPRILTVWFNCSILSGFFRTVTGLICKILSSISLSG